MTQQEKTFWAFLGILKIKISKTKFLDSIKSHPDFPSFMSFSDLLTELNVENVTLHASSEEIKNLPKPQLVELKDKKLEYVIIIATNNGSVQYLQNKKEISEPITNFDKKWNNIALVAKTNNKSGEINYEQSLKNQLFSNLRQLITVTIVVFIIIFQLITNAQLKELQFFPYIFILLTKVMGMAISILFTYSAESGHPFRKLTDTFLKNITV